MVSTSGSCARSSAYLVEPQPASSHNRRFLRGHSAHESASGPMVSSIYILRSAPRTEGYRSRAREQWDYCHPEVLPQMGYAIGLVPIKGGQNWCSCTVAIAFGLLQGANGIARSIHGTELGASRPEISGAKRGQTCHSIPRNSQSRLNDNRQALTMTKKVLDSMSRNLLK